MYKQKISFYSNKFPKKNECTYNKKKDREMDTVLLEWDELNLNSITYHCMRKMILSEKYLSTYITKYTYFVIYYF